MIVKKYNFEEFKKDIKSDCYNGLSDTDIKQLYNYCSNIEQYTLINDAKDLLNIYNSMFIDDYILYFYDKENLTEEEKNNILKNDDYIISRYKNESNEEYILYIIH